MPPRLALLIVPFLLACFDGGSNWSQTSPLPSDSIGFNGTIDVSGPPSPYPMDIDPDTGTGGSASDEMQPAKPASDAGGAQDVDASISVNIDAGPDDTDGGDSGAHDAGSSLDR